MAGFLYFKPNHLNPITRADLVAWGLGYAFPRSVAAGLCNSNTPVGAPGTVFADPGGERSAKLCVAEQTWRKLPQSDVWCGYWNDERPTPADLARTPQLPGYSVMLAGGQEWIIPLVRRFDVARRTSVSNLPTYMECDDDGNWHRGPVLDLHAHLWDVTRPIADALLAEYVEGQPPEVADGAILTAIVALLAANYRVGKGELSLIRALTNEANTHAGCMAACDWPTFMLWSEEQKKSELQPPQGDSTTSAGEAD